MQIKTYKDLIVWQKAMLLTIEIYRLTASLPRAELYGLSSQMRRCAVSIPSNIAEGFQRGHRPEQAQFMQVAYGSSAELETQLELCKTLGYLTPEHTQAAEELLQEVGRMLNTIIQKLRSN